MAAGASLAEARAAPLPRPPAWRGAQDVCGDGLLLKRQLRGGVGAACAAACAGGGEARLTHRPRVPGHDFPARETVVALHAGGPLDGLLLPGRIATAALRTMCEGECATFWIDARLLHESAQDVPATRAWCEDGYEWIEEAYEWELEVLRCTPARAVLSSPLATRRGRLALPRLGLGLYMVEPKDAYAATLEALRVGYGLIDTASMYQNEAAVGRALRDSGMPRDSVVVVSKLNNPDHGYHETLRAVERSRAELGVERIDLMLIHSPLGARILETWDALLEARRRGWILEVGVSNFGVGHLLELEAAGREVPAVNQFELSPFCQEVELRRYCAQKDIVVMGYAPLTRGSRLADARVVDVARKHGKSSAQVLIRWALQQGVVSIPKSLRPERLRENLAAELFELDDSDVARLGRCEENLHTCWDCLSVPWSG